MWTENTVWAAAKAEEHRCIGDEQSYRGPYPVGCRRGLRSGEHDSSGLRGLCSGDLRNGGAA
jgi:hypothetical protein